jgi:hypothetical protein
MELPRPTDYCSKSYGAPLRESSGCNGLCSWRSEYVEEGVRGARQVLYVLGIEVTPPTRSP